MTRTVRALVLALASTSALPQISFGPASSSDNKQQQPAGEVDVADLSSRNNFGSTSGNYQPGTIDCCCVAEGTSCLSGLNHGNSGNIDDLVGLGLIDERIVNRPGAGHSSNLGSGNNYQCPLGQRQCCYTDARLSCPSSAASSASSGNFEFGGSSSGNSFGNNNLNSGTAKVITAAHNLKNIRG